MSITPHKWQVTFDNESNWKDFYTAEEAEAFMENWPNDSSVMVFDEHSNEIENYGPNNEYWAIVDNEPADDGYDYDRYY